MKAIVPGGIVRALIALGLVSYQAAPALATDRPATAPSQLQWVTQLIVKEKAGVRPQSIATDGTITRASVATVQRWSAAAQLPVTYKRPMSGGAHVVTLPGVMTLAEAQTVASRMESSGQFEFVSPDKILRPTSVPSDPQFSNQWNLWPSTAGAGGATTTSVGGANLPKAWDTTKGANTTYVAVIDTGIITNHEDLAGAHIRSGYDFIGSDTLAGATDPQTNKTIPTSFVENDSPQIGRDNDPSDPGDWVSATDVANFPTLCGSRTSNSSWHGTFVTGQIVAQHNTLGIAGIAPNVTIQMARALGKCGGSTSDIMDALAWVTGANDVPSTSHTTGAPLPVNAPMARVVNMSLGGSGACSTIEQSTITAARARGAVIAVATGNDGVNSVGSPANCNGVIAVTAHTTDGDTAIYANLGAQTTISAPGGGPGYVVAGSGAKIVSTSNAGTQAPGADTNTYGSEMGTSMATPHVAGVAALLLSYKPTLTVDDVTNILKQSARPYPANSYCATHASICGAGMLDAGAAIAVAVGNPTVHATPSASSIAVNNAVTLTAGGSAGYGNTVSSVQWTQTSGAAVSLTTAGPDANGNYTATFTPANAGTYAFTVTLTNSMNAVTTASTQVTVTPAAVSTATPSSSGGGGGGHLPLWLAGLLLVAGAFGFQRRKTA